MEFLPLKTILIASLGLFIISCNDNKSKKTKVQEVTLTDIKQEEEKNEPPPPPPPRIPPPQVEMMPAPTLCFVNDGLKYKTTISIIFGGDNIKGSVISEDIDNGKKEKSDFEGSRHSDTIYAKFKKDPPSIGASSEWIVTPWIIQMKDGKESLRIKFYAKNYDTNKWENTDYEFEWIDCN